MRSQLFIETFHTVIFILMSCMLFALLYEVIFDQITTLSWIAVGAFVIEGLILVANGWKCPLTNYAEELGSVHGQVTDIFLPKWFADRVFQIYGGLFALAIVLLAFRLLV
jgi:hypothetical protein